LDRVNGEWKGREQQNKEKEIKSSTTERKKEPHRSSATYHKEISRDLGEAVGISKSDSTPFLSWHSGYLSKSQKKQGINGTVLFNKNRWNNRLLIVALYKLMK
jgi:hypothetical protein